MSAELDREEGIFWAGEGFTGGPYNYYWEKQGQVYQTELINRVKEEKFFEILLFLDGLKRSGGKQ